MVSMMYQRSLSLALALVLGSMPALAQHNSSPTFPQPSRPTAPQPQGALEQADALNQQAIELYQAGRYDEAIALAEEALAIRVELLGQSHPDVAISLNNLAELYSSLARYEEAIPIFQQALAIWREQYGEGDPRFALALGNLANLYRNQGRYAEAAALAEQSLDIVQTFFSESEFSDEPEFDTLAATFLSRGLHNLAAIYAEQGRYGEAETLYLQSLEISREQLGEYHPQVAISLKNLAQLYAQQGRYTEAEPIFLEALAILRDRLGNRPLEVADNLSDLAGLYTGQGRYVEALSLYLQVVEMRQEYLGDRHPDVVNSIHQLAIVYYRLAVAYGLLENYDEAEQLYRRVLEIRREQLGDRHPDVATSLNSLGLLYSNQGRYEEADTFYQDALEIRREQLGDHHPAFAISLQNLAGLRHAQGRYEEAQALYQQSLGIYQDQLGDRHPLVAINFNNLSVVYQAQNNDAEALQALGAALAIEEWHLDLNLAVLSDAQRQDYIAGLAVSTDAALSLHLQSTSPEAAALAMTTVLRRKGRVLDAGINELQVLRQNLTPADQRILDDLTVLRQQLATLTFNPPPNLDPATVARLEAEANQLEADLARRSASFRAEAQPVELAAVQAQIPADGVLVEYVRYQPLELVNTNSPWGAERYAAYLLFPNGDIQAIDLGSAAEIDAAVGEFSLRLRDLTQSPTAAARALSAQILDPLRPHLSDREHLLISPDGPLSLIPFEALRSAEGDYLIQDYQISYLNSGRDLLKFDLNEPSREPAVIVANPDYETASGSPALGEGQGVRATGQQSIDLSQLQVGPLPGTAAEAAAIAPLLPNATVLTETQATENALKQVDAPRILHIATHGFFLADVARNEAGRGLGVVSAAAPSSRAPSVTVENPLLRSGLALAGFNARSSGSEDGVLTALEASGLNLLGTQLVVLSACETGLGDVANGDGIYGLRRAFAIAGAETQVLSLWQVDDFATQSLMTRYYEQLLAGQGRAESLRQVQIELINSGSIYAHPFYWAAFITAGDWRPLDE